MVFPGKPVETTLTVEYAGLSGSSDGSGHSALAGLAKRMVPEFDIRANDTSCFLLALTIEAELDSECGVAFSPHVLISAAFPQLARTFADHLPGLATRTFLRLQPFFELSDLSHLEPHKILIKIRTETVASGDLVALSPSSSTRDVISHLFALRSDANRQGMLRYGIKIERALGISHGVQRDIARKIKRNHIRAFELWETGIVEAQFIASVTADPKLMTLDDARRWAAAFDSWDIVDGVSDLFVDMDGWRELIDEFATDKREFVRRTAFAMICWASVHRKKEADATFAAYLPLIDRHAQDPRNFVRKAVNWALRTIGKRSLALHAPALKLAEKLAASEDKTARWIGKDAVRELTDPKQLERLARKG